MWCLLRKGPSGAEVQRLFQGRVYSIGGYAPRCVQKTDEATVFGDGSGSRRAAGACEYGRRFSHDSSGRGSARFVHAKLRVHSSACLHGTAGGAVEHCARVFVHVSVHSQLCCVSRLHCRMMLASSIGRSRILRARAQCQYDRCFPSCPSPAVAMWHANTKHLFATPLP